MNAFLRNIVVLMGFVSSNVYAQTSLQKPQKFEVGMVHLLNTPTILSASSKGKLIWKIKSPGNICSVLDYKQVGFVFNLCNSILVLNRQNGKAVWYKSDLAIDKIESFEKDRLLVETTISGALTGTLTIVINVKNGTDLAKAYGIKIWSTPKYVLLIGDGSPDTYGSQISLFKIDVATNKVEHKTFSLSPRSGCGTEDDLTGAWDSSVDHADDRFVYFQRTDLCGAFDIKLEWIKGF